MTTQDTDDTDGEHTDGTASTSQSDSNAPETDIDEIASEPAGDVDDILNAIVEQNDQTDDDASATGDDDAESDTSDVSHDETAASDQGDDDAGTDGQTTLEDSLVIDPDAVNISDEDISQIEQVSTEAIAEVLALLRADRARLQEKLAETTERADDFESRLKRKQADFQNYKKRQEEKLEDERQRATEDLVERLLDVRDNLERALDQDDDADIRSGIESTLEQFDEQLRRENVEKIEPEPGQSTDPMRHEVLATIESDQPEDTIAGVHRPGYEMADKVLRPAQVTVSDGSGDGEA